MILCPRCSHPMVPYVRLEWPHEFTILLCRCDMLMAIGALYDEPPSMEFIENYSLLLANGYLSVL